MRAVWLEVPEDFLEERRRLGHDKRDELWEGVLHMVPPASYLHASVSDELVAALTVIARRRGWIARSGQAGLFQPATDTSYRVPDAMVARPEHVSERGLEGAVLVVEVLSPNDESRDKFPFFARLGVDEVWLVEPRTREVEVHTLRDGRYHRVAASGSSITSPALGVTLATVDGPHLRLCDGDTIVDI